MDIQHMTTILNHLRSSPPPKVNPNFPLLPGAPPPSHLPLNPVLYLTLAIDSVAPICRIRSIRGAAGGGNALQIPEPLRARQRRRKSIEWILDAAGKKSPASGHFAMRVAQELIAVVEGRSAVWQRRANLHKIAVGSRANINYKPMKRR
jgi:small subunit ribosomal protein S7